MESQSFTEGQRFGRGAVIGAGIHCGRQMRPGAILLCDCGQHYSAILGDLTSGGVASCGCLRRDVGRTNGLTNRTKHGLSSHPLYKTWHGMLRRCENPKDRKYPLYGGRGISVCPRWHDVAAFIEDVGPRPEGMSLDRIRNGLGYKPSNVRWATKLEQRHNRRPKVA